MFTENELEKIITLGVIQKEFQISGMTFLMRSLTAQEMWEVLREVSGYDDAAKMKGIEIKTLARSIIAINNKKLEYIPEEKDDIITYDKLIKQNERILGKTQGGIIDLLYTKYGELMEEQEHFLQQCTTELKKNGQDKNGKSVELSELKK